MPFFRANYSRTLTLLVIFFLNLFTKTCWAEPSSAQVMDWDSRRKLSQTLQQKSLDLRSEADEAFSTAEALCWKELLTNQCREEARRNKVRIYQEAKKFNIEGRRIELTVRQEEKAQKDRDFAATEPERAFKVRERSEETARRNQAQAEARESAQARHLKNIKEPASGTHSAQ
jgi:hypothetical protein